MEDTQGLNYRQFSHCPVLWTLALGPSLALLSTGCSGVSQIFEQGTLKDLGRVSQVTAPSWSGFLS